MLAEADAAYQEVKAAQIGKSLQVELSRNRKPIEATVTSAKLLSQVDWEG